MIFIYSLADPRTPDNIRYIGKTNDMKKRFYSHTSDKEVNYKTCWLKSLKTLGLKPEMKVIDIFDDDVNWEFWECHYISLYKSWGFKLVNSTNGGNGNCNVGRGINCKISQPVAQYSKESEELLCVYPSCGEAEIKTGIPQRGLTHYFNKRQSHGYGYNWKKITKEKYLELKDNYCTPYEKTFDPSKKYKIKGVNEKTGEILIFDSIFEAEKLFGKTNSISACLNLKAKTSKGYRWYYLDEIRNNVDVPEVRAIRINDNQEFIFKNKIEASDITGTKLGKITSCLTSKHKINNGYIWLNIGEEIPNIKKKEIKLTKVGQYDSNDHLLGVFNSIKEAIKATKYNRTDINDSLIKNLPTDIKWSYIPDEIYEKNKHLIPYIKPKKFYYFDYSKRNQHLTIKIKGTHITTKEVKYFDSIRQAEREFKNKNIVTCLKGYRQTAANYFWEYVK